MATHRELGEIYVDRLGFLMRWSAILASCLNKQEIFDRLARAAVPYLADWCTIIVMDSQDRFSRVGAAHVDPLLDRQMRKLSTDAFLPEPGARIGIPRAIRTGNSELLRNVRLSDIFRELGGGKVNVKLARMVTKSRVHCMMTAPLVAHGRVLGAISMFNRGHRAPFEIGDLALAEELARRAALTLNTLLQLEHAGQEVEVFEHAMSIFRQFIVSRVEDARTPLTAGRLKVELISLKEKGTAGERALLGKILVDLDRAIEVITTIADAKVYRKLMSDARGMQAKKAA